MHCTGDFLMKWLLLVGLGLLALTQGAAQQAVDPVLFVVEDDSVRQAEFDYIYQKTSPGETSYTQASLEEYLQLYLRFKLKVCRARELGLDTLASLQQELQGYRQNLAASYLIDRTLLDSLIQEAYRRRQQDVDISHILIGLHPLAAPEDTVEAYRRAMEARRQLEAGEPFAEVAKAYSDDSSVEANEGHIGFVTALFPNGYYPLETAAYTLSTGTLSMPVRSSAGYHILKVHARRPARGEIDIAHLMLRHREDRPEAVKRQIDSLYQLLQGGADFAVLARQFSEDASTRSNAGRIGLVGINRFETAFEDAAFQLEHDGEVSAPVRSSIGWHLIKRLNKPDVQPFSTVRYLLEQEIRADDRFDRVQQSVVEREKKEVGFFPNRQARPALLDTVSRAFFQPGWRAGKGSLAATPLFTVGDSTLHLAELDAFLATTRAERQELAGGADPRMALEYLLDEYEKQTVLDFLDRHLEARYPEFRFLMKEYREGILLFEATQREVWQPAATDTAGLQRFFEAHREDFTWPARARATEYFLRGSAAPRLETLRALARQYGPEEVARRFDSSGERILAFREQVLNTETDKEGFGPGEWEVGALSETRRLAPNETLTFFKVEEIIPPQPKTLEEARGYVTAAYQDELEKRWVAQLREKYDVRIMEKTLNDMIK